MALLSQARGDKPATHRRHCSDDFREFADSQSFGLLQSGCPNWLGAFSGPSGSLGEIPWNPRDKAETADSFPATRLSGKTRASQNHMRNLQNSTTYVQMQQAGLEKARQIFERISVLATQATDPFMTNSQRSMLNEEMDGLKANWKTYVRRISMASTSMMTWLLTPFDRLTSVTTWMKLKPRRKVTSIKLFTRIEPEA